MWRVLWQNTKMCLVVVCVLIALNFLHLHYTVLLQMIVCALFKARVCISLMQGLERRPVCAELLRDALFKFGWGWLASHVYPRSEIWRSNLVRRRQSKRG